METHVLLTEEYHRAQDKDLYWGEGMKFWKGKKVEGKKLGKKEMKETRR